MNSVEKALKVKHGITQSTGNTKKKSGGHSVASALEAYEAKYERRKQSRYDNSGLDGITEYNTSLYGELDKASIGSLDDKSKSEWVTRISEAKDRNNKAYTYLKNYGANDLGIDTAEAQKYLEGVMSGLDELIKVLEYKAPTEQDYIEYLENPYTSKYKDVFGSTDEDMTVLPSMTDGPVRPKFMTSEFDAASYKWQKKIASGTSAEAQEQLQALDAYIKNKKESGYTIDYRDVFPSVFGEKPERDTSMDKVWSKYTDKELEAEKRRLENLYAARKATEEYKVDSKYKKLFSTSLFNEDGSYNRKGTLDMIEALYRERSKFSPEDDNYNSRTEQIEWLEKYDADNMSSVEMGTIIENATKRREEIKREISNLKIENSDVELGSDEEYEYVRQLEALEAEYDELAKYLDDSYRTDWYNRRGKETVEKVDADPEMGEATAGVESLELYELLTAVYNAWPSAGSSPSGNAEFAELYSKVPDEYTNMNREQLYDAAEKIRINNMQGMSKEDFKEHLTKMFSDNGYDIEIYSDYKTRMKNEKKMEVLTDSMAQGAVKNGWSSVGYSLASIGTNLGSWQGWTASGAYAIRNIMNDLSGEHLEYKPVDPNSVDFQMTAITQTIRSSVGEKIANNTNWELWGTNVSKFLYDTGMSMGDFLAATALTGGGNTALALMGSASAGSSAYQVLQNGGSTEQAFLYGTLTGLTEMATEKFSLDGLKAFQSVEVTSFKSWISNALKQTFTEASEETVASVADAVWDELINGDNSAYNKAVADYMSRGYTQDRAEQMALQNKIVETMFSALGGALSGFSIGSAAGGINYMSYKNAERGANAQIDEVFEYSAEAFDLSTHEGQSRTIELTDTVERLNAEGVIPEGSDLVQRAQSIKERINNNTDFGFGKYEYQPVDQSEVRSLYLETADIVSRDATGKLRAEGENDNSSDIDPVAKLAEDMTEVEGNATAPVQTEIPSGAMQSSFIQDDIDIDTSVAVKNTRPEITPSLSPVVYKGKEAKVTGVTKDGKVKLQTAEGEATADKNEIYSDDNTAYILANAPDMGSVRIANLYVTAYDPSVKPEAYTKAYKKISEMVYKGEGKISTMRVVGADFADGIDADTASVVYDELVRYKRAAEARKIKGAPKDIEGSVRGVGLKKVSADARIFLEEFAKSFKVDINVADGTADGSLGSTNPLSRRITLSVKSANSLSTLLHESGHLMKAWDSDTFYAIQDAVCDWFAKYNNTTLEHLIEARQAEYTDKEGKPCSYQEAKDEVTCNAIEAIQTAENFAEEFAQTMADLQYTKAEAEENLTALQKFFRKIKLALNNILDRIRNKRSGDLMITAEGKAISKDVAMVNDLLKKVRQGLTNVRTNYDAYVAGAEVKSAGDGKVRKMYSGKNSVSSDVSNNTDLDESLGEQLQDWLNGFGKKHGTYNGRYFELGTTPNILSKYGAKSIPMIMYEDCVAKVTGMKGDGAHNIALDEISKLPSELNDPIMLFKGSVNNSFIAITDIIDKQGNDVVVAIHLNKYVDRIEINKIASMYSKTNDYGYNRIVPYVNNQINNGNLLYASIKRAPNWFSSRGLQLPKLVQTILDANNSVTETDPDVNTNSSTDSDGELKQHISSEADEQAKADELLALREENKALKAMDKRRWQMIDYLQRQLDQWKKGGKKLDYRGIEKLARSLINDYGAKVDVKAYAKELTGFFNYMTNNAKPSADVIRKRYTELAEKLIHNVEAVNVEVQEQLKNIRHIIRDGVALNVNQRGDVLHRFDTMAKYHEKVGGTVKITNKGIPLDEAWQELSDMYPDMFPADTTDADQPIVMAEVISMLNENLKYNPIAEEYLGNEEAALMDAVAKIVDGFHNIPELVDAKSAYKSAFAEAKAYFEQDKEKLIRMNQENRKWYKEHYKGWYQGKLNTVAMESARRFESYRESRAKTDERRKIKRIMNDLQKAVANPTKNRYVPTGLYTTMIEVCKSLDMGYNLDTKVGQQMDMLSNKIGDLLDEYDKLKAASGDGSSEAYEYASEYSEAIRESLATIKETTKGRSIASLTLGELMTVRTLLNDISQAMKDARIQIDAEDNIENYDLGMRAYEELDKTKRFGKINLLLSGEMYTAMNFVDMICNYDPNAVLNQQMKKLEEGCRRMEEYYMEASKPFVELQERDKGKPYTDFISKGYDMGLVDENGKHVMLTKAMACQIIMSWEREQANPHLVHMSDGSIKIPNLELLQKGKYKEALQKDNCHRVRFVNDSDMLNLREHMDDYCKEWMAAARDYFDGMAKHKVNEVTMKLLHRVAALSENYIPFEVDQDYVHKDIERLNHNSLLENAGILKPITPKAKQGLVMMGLNVVLNKHIDTTSKLYGLAVPIRNFNKVYDTMNVKEEKSLKEMINTVTKQVAHGKGTENVIEQILAELQSGRQGGDHGAIYNWFRSNQVSAILSFKLSAALKQTTAYAVAGYKLSANALRVGQSKSFKRNLTDKSRKAWFDEIDGYTAKHFMRRQGLSTTELGDLVKMGKSTKQSPLHGAKWLQAMDVHVTAMLFEAAKAEVDMRIEKGRVGYKKGSAEYRKAVKELYEEVIEQTQANYDVLHRSNIQRDERFVSKQLTLFKTDAFINSNILYSSAARWAAAKRRGNKAEIKATGKAFGKAVASQLAANATLTLMTIIGNGLLRHKMDDYLDENGEMTWDSFIEEVLWTYFGEAGRTLTLLPSSVFDIFSLVEKLIRGGYTNVTTDLLSPWLESFDKNVTSLIGAFVGCFEKGVPAKDKLWGVGGPLWELGTMAAEFFGIPAGNITDMINALRLYGEDIVQGITGNSDGTFAGYERKNKQKYRIMYDAVIAGDKDKYTRYEKEMLEGKSATHQNIFEGVAGYITGERVKPVEQSKIDSGIAEHLAKNDELRTVALYCIKQDWYNYTEGFSKLEDMGFSEAQILKAEKKVTDTIGKLAYADPSDDEYAKLLSKLYDLGLEDDDIEQGIKNVKSFAVYDGEGSITSDELKYSYKMLAEAVIDSDVDAAVRMYTYLTEEAEKESKTIRSQLTQYIKPIYKQAKVAERTDIRNFLMKNCGYKYGDFEKWLKD